MQSDDENKSGYNAFDDLSIPSEEILKMLVNDVRHCIGSIEVSLYILQLERTTAETKQRTIESITLHMQQIRNLPDDTLTYIEKRKALYDSKADG